ncbi:hypothetical protein [Suipraeoptans intestinalis]|uniref:hypothetical protein n=1 Tax=Suipraeoptans intestinalis TaxID=2606628 RepID=UPI001F292836|nr:hypothetical protein [Suipraeoptans intestinalis]
MGRCIRVAIAGLGSRGYDVYGRAIKAHPDKMRIVAVADPDPEKRKKHRRSTDCQSSSVSSTVKSC